MVAKENIDLRNMTLQQRYEHPSKKLMKLNEERKIKIANQRKEEQAKKNMLKKIAYEVKSISSIMEEKINRFKEK